MMKKRMVILFSILMILGFAACGYAESADVSESEGNPEEHIADGLNADIYEIVPEALTDGATWLPGTRLNGGSSHETIVDWINGLGLNIKAE